MTVKSPEADELPDLRVVRGQKACASYGWVALGVALAALVWIASFSNNAFVLSFVVCGLFLPVLYGLVLRFAGLRST